MNRGHDSKILSVGGAASFLGALILGIAGIARLPSPAATSTEIAGALVVAQAACPDPSGKECDDDEQRATEADEDEV